MQALATAPSVPTDWRALDQGRALRFDADACLPMRHRGDGCSRCESVCPVSAIVLEPAGPRVAEGCTGCGRCAADCPMGALALPGFELSDFALTDVESPDLKAQGAEVAARRTEQGEPASAGSVPEERTGRGGSRGADEPPLRFECARVARGDLEAATAVVPCLGGLDAAVLIRAHGGRGIGPVLVDRGLCADCPSGGRDAPPVGQALAQARDLLESMGVALPRLPRLERGPAVRPVPEAGPAHAARRGFLAALVRGSGRAASRAVRGERLVSATQAGDAVPDALRLARQARPSRARLELLAACLAVSRRSALPMPFTLFRSVCSSGACCDSGVCCATCPTGALFRREAPAAAFPRVPEGGGGRAQAGLAAEVGPDAVSGSNPDDTATTAPAVELVFDALRCIDCGACVRACPESALAMVARSDDGWRAPEVVRRFGRMCCTRCGDAFTAVGGATECDPCAKSSTLVRDAFRSFAARAPQSENRLPSPHPPSTRSPGFPSSASSASSPFLHALDGPPECGRSHGAPAALGAVRRGEDHPFPEEESR